MTRRHAAAALVLLLAASASRADPVPGPTPPGLARWLGFHAGFETGVDADRAGGAAAPRQVVGRAALIDGPGGRSLRLGAGAGGAQVEYAQAKNLDLARPGAVSFWIAPQGWVDPERGGKSGYVRFFAVAGSAGSSFLVERDVRSDPLERLVVGLFGLPDGEQHLLQLAYGPRWRPGSWHLIAISWDGGGFALSVDGGPLVRKGVPDGRVRTSFGGAPGSWYVGDSAAEATALDELSVYGRALRDEDVALLWQSGRAR